MNAIREFNIGRYIEGHSLLHRLDPRVKLLVLPATIIAVFSSPGWPQLSVAGAWIAGLLTLSGIDLPTHLRGLRLLRWLFLFTLVLHLFLTPGRTLFGLSWLSYDGLLHGLFVIVQLALAVLLSSLMTLTTAPAKLALALEWLLSPLHVFGLAAKGSGGLLVWVLHFVPILREEAALVMEEQVAHPSSKDKGLLARAGQVRQAVAPLLARLVGRADRLAHAVARGESPLTEEERTLARFRFMDGVWLIVGLAAACALGWRW